MDEAKMMTFVENAVGDVGALLGGAMVVIGDKLGLYRAMAGAGWLSPADVACRTGTVERYVREWSSAQAARGYLLYDGAGHFMLPDEHAIPLTDETSPACVIGAFEIGLGSVYATDTIVQRFRTGTGFPWGDQDKHVLDGCERFFRPGYLNHLASEWIPALDGVESKLTAGARIADVGCGHGASTVLLAEAYPASTIVGFDADEGSIDAALKRAADAGLADRVRFEVASATAFEGDFDLVLLLRLPARHGRSGRGVHPRARPSAPRRHPDAHRAVRQRPPERQPQPGRRSVLRVLDPALHTELVVPGRG